MTGLGDLISRAVHGVAGAAREIQADEDRRDGRLLQAQRDQAEALLEEHDWDPSLDQAGERGIPRDQVGRVPTLSRDELRQRYNAGGRRR